MLYNRSTIKKYISTQTLAANGLGPAVLSLRERLHNRTCELALMAGRHEFEVKQCDYEQAKRDVTGEKSAARQNAVLGAPLGRRFTIQHAN